MASTEELDFLIETAKLEHAMADAKAAFAEVLPGDDGYDEAHQAYRAAKDAARAHRQFWREVRAFIAAPVPDGDAVAAPDTHGMGVTPQEATS